MATNVPTDRYIQYFVSRLELLKQFEIIPVIVLDGMPLPMKNDTKESREQVREDNLQKGKLLLSQGKSDEAYVCFAAAISITSEMTNKLIHMLRYRRIEFIVAPYEADAQLAFLQRTGYVDYCLTEDSDLFVFGATKILYKLEKNGDCQILDKDLLNVDVLEGENDCITFCNKLKTYSQRQIAFMCCLSGCDYCNGLFGYGLKKAQKQLSKYAENFHRLLSDEVRNSKLDKNVAILIISSFLTFCHQRVVDPKTRELTYLFPLDASTEKLCSTYNLDISTLNFLGPYVFIFIFFRL